MTHFCSPFRPFVGAFLMSPPLPTLGTFESLEIRKECGNCSSARMLLSSVLFFSYSTKTEKNGRIMETSHLSQL